MPLGRPSLYTPELADEVCERIACGESLKAIAREQDKPDERQFYRWLRDNEEFRQQYTLAREAQGDADADAVSDIGQRALTGEIDANAARVAIDALKWSAGKRKPKVYGDRQQIDVSGSLHTKSDDELSDRITLLTSKLDASTG